MAVDPSRCLRKTSIASSDWRSGRTAIWRRCSMARKRLVLAGIVGRYPVGGVTWCALQYIAGFQRLGYDVVYLEDTGEANFDPTQNGIATDPSYALGYLDRELARVGLQDDWCYVDF